MKKGLALLLSLVLVVSMVACSAKKDSTDTAATQPTTVAEPTAAPTVAVTEEPTAVPTEAVAAATSAVNGMPFENSVLYDQDGFKVTTVSLGEDDYGDQALKLKLENNSDKDVTFQMTDLSVNGFMFSSTFYAEVTAGNKADGEVTLYTSDLELCEIAEIQTIELKVLISEASNLNTIAESEVITLSNTAASGSANTYDTTGEVVYDDQEIKVISQYIYRDDIMGQELVFYIENNSQKSVTVQNASVAVSGNMVDAVLYCDVLPGKKAVTEMSFLGLEELGINDITDLEYSLNILDTDTAETIADTEKIVLTFEPESEAE